MSEQVASHVALGFCIAVVVVCFMGISWDISTEHACRRAVALLRVAGNEPHATMIARELGCEQKWSR